MRPRIHRRDFFKLAGAGAVVAIAQQERGMPQEISAWLHIGENGAVTLYAGKAEMGQNVRTSLAQAAAEELGVPVESIRMVLGDTDLTPWDAGTFGSRTTPYLAPQIRRAAAAAREMLIDLAKDRLKAERTALTASGGRITDAKSGRSVSYGELTRGQKLLKTIPADTSLKAAAEWRVAGKYVRKVDGRAMVTGAHLYPSDITRPGMLYGKVLRAPAWNVRLVSVDGSVAKALPGVHFIHEGGFVGVAAADERAAAKALEAVKAEWSESPQPSEREIFDYLRKTAGPPQGQGIRRGSIERGMSEADVRLKQTYTVAYIAHAPLEPRAAVAEWEGGKLTVWTGSQRPFGVRSELASAFQIPEERVRVIIPDTGSGYGGKHTSDAAIEAARLAKAAGKPVKVVWTREEEFRWAYFRPAGIFEVSSGMKKDGSITAWEFHNYNSGPAGLQTMYDIPHQLIVHHPCRSPLRQGSYRALAATANHFAREVHMDEMAQAASMDPLEFRLKNLKDERLRAVLVAAAERFGWSKRKKEAGRGYGIAGGFEKGSYVATCVEVSAPAGGPVKIVRVVEAFECGAIVNPDHLENQVVGMIIMGLGGALFEAVRFENGRMLNPRFSRYRVPRFSDTPPIEVVLLDRKDLASAGGGETPICGIAPALSNAIFDARGQRLRSLPLLPPRAS